MSGEHGREHEPEMIAKIFFTLYSSWWMVVQFAKRSSKVGGVCLGEGNDKCSLGPEL